jgi:hypothetical protein
MSFVLKSLDAVTSDAAGDALALNSPTSEYSLQVNFAGTISGTGPSLYLEGSLDGVNFFRVGFMNGQTSGSAYVVNATGALAAFVRAEVTGLSGGGTVTAYVAAK